MNHRNPRSYVFALLVLAACGDDSGSQTNAATAGTGAAQAGSSAPVSTGGTSAPAAGGGGKAGTGAAGTSAASAGRASTAGTGASGTGAAGATAGAGGAAGAAAGALAAGGGGASGAAAGSGGGSAGAPAAGGACDHACLLAIMQGYIDALLAKDPTKLKVAASLKYTENGAVSKLGDTVWKTIMTLVDGARLDFADPQEGQVASQFAFNETGSVQVIYMVRLKVVSGEITEIESMAVRRSGAANGFFNVANMKPEAVFLQAVDPAKRMTRDQLKMITEQYLDYLEGKKSGSAVPFDAMCKRFENGQVTATGTSSFNSQSWSFQVTRRILVIDEEEGITWGMFPFQQTASALVVGEAFKIIEGKIMMIQAVMANMPAKAWD